jgi:hypothetical protein
MTAQTWYIEIYDSKGIEPKRVQRVSDFTSVRQLILDVRNAEKGEIVRVLAPHDVTPEEQQQLRELGAYPL